MAECHHSSSAVFALSGEAGVAVCAGQCLRSLRAVGQCAVPSSGWGELPRGYSQSPATPAPPRRVGEREGCRPPHQSQQKDGSYIQSLIPSHGMGLVPDIQIY